jgi:hypothetical protein
MRSRRPKGDGSRRPVSSPGVSNQVDPKHPLVRLVELIEWQRFETAFGGLYHETAGRLGNQCARFRRHRICIPKNRGRQS